MIWVWERRRLLTLNPEPVHFFDAEEIKKLADSTLRTRTYAPSGACFPRTTTKLN